MPARTVHATYRPVSRIFQSRLQRLKQQQLKAQSRLRRLVLGQSESAEAAFVLWLPRIYSPGLRALGRYNVSPACGTSSTPSSSRLANASGLILAGPRDP